MSNNNNYGRIPEELQTTPQWLNWYPTPRKDGGTNKVPCDGTAKAIDWKNPANFITFTQAITNLKTNPKLSGITFIITSSNIFVFIDLDKCVDDKGQVSPFALKMVKYFNSYTEFSQSGKGLHIFIKMHTLPPEHGTKKVINGQEVEIYSKNRSAVFTGNVFEDYNKIEYRDDKFLTFLNKSDLLVKPKPQVPPIHHIMTLDEQQVFDKFIKHDFNRSLYEGQHSYPSHNEADMALCGSLAFFTNDSQIIDTIFRNSGLYRDKWDKKHSANGETYGQMTIWKAIQNKSKRYTGGNGNGTGIHQSNNQNTGGNKTKEMNMEIEYNTNQTSEDNYEALIAEMENQLDEAINSSQVKVKDGCIVVDDNKTLFPHIGGLAEDWANLISEYMETPREFLIMGFITMLGHVLSEKVMIDTSLNPQPRLYTIFLGESADTRKSESITQSVKFFDESLMDAIFKANKCNGVGSAEGLAKQLSETNRVILIQDELKALVQKMSVQGSVLLPCITSLFQQNQYANKTQKHDIKIDNAHLSILGASTLDTFETMFKSTYTDIGFINRLFLVLAEGKRKVPIPEPIPDSRIIPLRARLLRMVNDNQIPYRFPIEQDAKTLFDNWYHHEYKGEFSRRLDAYGHRLMPLLAINDNKRVIDKDVMIKIINLLRYERKIREVAHPIDVDNVIAEIEGRIKKKLREVGGRISKRDLERSLAKVKNKYSSYYWRNTIDNLIKGKEIIIEFEGTTKPKAFYKMIDDED